MTASTVRITLGLGPAGLVPAPAEMMDALERVNVTHAEDSMSSLQISFRAQRRGPADAMDFPIVGNFLLRPFGRLILSVAFGSASDVLFDGVITRRDLRPGPGGNALFTVTAQDVGYAMSTTQRVAEFPMEPDFLIAAQILAGYFEYGMLPETIPPLATTVPLPVESIPTQVGTDHDFLKMLAARNGHVFQVFPGPVAGANVGYWGPRIRPGLPAPTITFDMGAGSNAESVEFAYDATQGTLVSGAVQDAITNAPIPVETFLPLNVPLSAVPHWIAGVGNLRTQRFSGDGLDAAEAYAQAQAITDASFARVVQANGVLLSASYGAVLKPLSLVALRGAGWLHDGAYLVSSVTHDITRSSYKQTFALVRDGLGSLLPEVPP